MGMGKLASRDLVLSRETTSTRPYINSGCDQIKFLRFTPFGCHGGESLGKTSNSNSDWVSWPQREP